jgi:hypothetical protein
MKKTDTRPRRLVVIFLIGRETLGGLMYHLLDSNERKRGKISNFDRLNVRY